MQELNKQLVFLRAGGRSKRCTKEKRGGYFQRITTAAPQGGGGRKSVLQPHKYELGIWFENQRSRDQHVHPLEIFQKWQSLLQAVAADESQDKKIRDAARSKLDSANGPHTNQENKLVRDNLAISSLLTQHHQDLTQAEKDSRISFTLQKWDHFQYSLESGDLRMLSRLVENPAWL